MTDALIIFWFATWFCNGACAAWLLRSRSSDIAIIAACVPPSGMFIVALDLTRSPSPSKQEG